MTNRFTPKSQQVLECSKSQAEKMGHTYIGSEHLLLGIMCTECVASKILDEKGALYTKIYDYVVEISGSGVPCSIAITLTPKCKKILEASLGISKKFNSKFIGTEHILYAICEENDSVAYKILSSMGLSIQGIKNEISSISESLSSFSSFSKKEPSLPPLLSIYGKNLNFNATSGSFDPLIGRENDISRLIQILCRRTKNNPCLIGEPGVGKTAIVEGLAKLLSEGNVPFELEDKVIVSLDLTAMIAGTKYRGEFEERMKAVLNEVTLNPKIILFIDEIHTIMGAGGAEGAIDAANIIKPSLARGDFRVIGATTIDEYRRHIEKDSALERRFQPIYIQEPSESEAIEILRGLKPSYEAHHKVKISDDAISASVTLSSRYIGDRYLPDKAIDLLDEACSRKKMNFSEKSEAVKRLERQLSIYALEKENAVLDGSFEKAVSIRDKEASVAIELNKEKEKCQREIASRAPSVTSDDICEIITLQTKIPVNSNDIADTEKLKMLHSTLCSKIIGQNEAISSVVSSIKRGRLGIKSPFRPCASFLFLGPTGVGKTELAKQISNSIFDDKDAFIRFDMSEFSEKHSVSKLIGAPAGYVGYEDGGILCEKVRRHPYSVVLFDEIEKAHPDIYNILLQILDEGILTSSNGKKINFKNTIIILTSNIGGKEISRPSSLGFSQGSAEENMRPKINELLKKEFSAEFLNRLDEIIVFNSLSSEDARKICKNLLNELSDRVKEKDIDLKFDDSALDFAFQKGYNKDYGARELRRAIINLFENPLCEAILSKSVQPNDKIIAKFDGEKIFYECMKI